MMEAATRNAEPAQPLPLFRAEALAARQKIQGEALFIRPFSLAFFIVLVACLIAVSMGFLFLAHFEPRATVAGSMSQTLRDAGGSAQPTTKAVFYVPQTLAVNLRPGLLVPVRCQQCGSSSFHSGTVTSVEPMDDADKNASLSDPSVSGAMCRVILSVTPFNPSGADQLQQSAKLEAEFPLQRRPLIHWLIGSVAW
jgi:hypothetical protein